MASQLLLLVAGAALTSLGGVLGVVLSSFLQQRSWARQHETQRREEELAQAQKTFEEIALFLDRRLYRMRRLYWAARDRAVGTESGEDFSATWSAYREVVTDWNDNLNRILALTETYFGGEVRAMLETQVYERFASLGRGLDVIVRMVSAADGKQVEVPRVGRRLDALSHRIYELDTYMLRLLSDRRAGRPARPGPEPDGAGGSRVLTVGDLGDAVRRLQRALRRDGQQVVVDGQFGRQTWLAVRSAQQAHGLNVDGIVGRQTWAALPSGGPMPVLRLGSSGPVVAAVQEILTRNAPGRWEATPDAVTGQFDPTTSAAVQAFQSWNAIPVDGQVGDRTWTAATDDAAVSLEDAAGLQYAADA
jgi:peptidoglycan hydrolase-like protein with peptidoglycan-binding domain